MKTPKNPDSNVRQFLSGRQDASSRYASFDHCYNYFQGHREAGTESTLGGAGVRQVSCLQLGFFLASWGMYRGSAALLQQSSRALLPAVELIAQAPATVWETDVALYDEDRIDQLLEFARAIGKVVPGGHSETLTSKIMLGVFGCVPAFDRYFRSGFVTSGFRKKALLEIRTYHEQNRELIESHRTATIDFEGKPTKRRYTQAKVIDMIFFVEGGG